MIRIAGEQPGYQHLREEEKTTDGQGRQRNLPRRQFRRRMWENERNQLAQKAGKHTKKRIKKKKESDDF